jgi:hypothetical protein
MLQTTSGDTRVSTDQLFLELNIPALQSGSQILVSKGILAFRQGRALLTAWLEGVSTEPFGLSFIPL